MQNQTEKQFLPTIRKIDWLMSSKGLSSFVRTVMLVLALLNGCIVNGHEDSTTAHLLHQLNQANSISERLDVQLQLSDYYSGNAPDKSAEYAAKVVADSSTATTVQLRNAYTLLGYSYYDKDEFSEALKSFQSGLTFAQKEGNVDQQIRLMAVISDCFRYLGLIESSFDIAFEGLKVADSLKDYKQIGKMCSRIGELYRDQNDSRKAIEYLQRSYTSFSKAGIERGMLAAKANLALAQKQVDPTKALETYQELISEFNHLFGTYDSARVYSNLANIYLDLDRFEEAENCLMTALELHQTIDRGVSLGYCYKELGELYTRTNQAKKVITYAQLSLEKAQESKHTLLQHQSHKLLADAYSALGKYENAYEHLSHFLNLNDSILKNEKIEFGKELEARYATEKKEQHIQLQEEQLARLAAEVNQESILRNTLITGLILLLILGLLVYRNAQLQKAKKLEIEAFAHKLQELQTTQSRWFTNVAHELRTPLTLILGPIRNLRKQKNLTPEQQAEVDLAERYGEQLEDRVNEILEVSKLESGKLSLQLELIEVNPFVQQVFDSFQSLMQEKDLQGVFIPASKDGIAKIDRDKVLKILNNLIGNAIKFTPSGGRVKVEIFISDSNSLHIQVGDTGIGIAQGEQQKVFDRFYQSNSGYGHNAGGTGVGLTLSQELANLHGGTITLSSNLGEGSTFTLQLPDNIVRKQEGISTKPANENEPLKKHKPARVLLVEDHLDMRRHIRNILENHYEVTEAADGQEALDSLDQGIPDLIISDIKMPGMDGLTFAKKIKEIPECRLIPFIHLTAHANEKEKLIALKAGVDDYLIKPFDAEELLARLNNLLTNYRERQLDRDKNSDYLSEDQLISHEEKQLQELQQLVNEHLSQSAFGVAELAQHSAMSTATLARLLKKTTGLTPGKFIREIRLQKALHLLETKQYATVAEVVYEVGFENVSSFSRLFKNRFGRSPSSYGKDPEGGNIAEKV